MNQKASCCPCTWLLIFGVGLAVATSVAFGAEIEVARTNWTERWITNVIDVRMPTNVFVDEFHTNWLRQFVTNIVDVYATNWVTQEVTNTISVPATHTVHVTEYKTNLTTLHRTNTVPVEAFRTNLVSQWQTNWRTFNFTNWETVLVLKTNWISQPVTNVVQIDIISNRPPPVAAAAHAKSSSSKETVVAPIVSSGPTPSDSLQLEAIQTGRRAPNGLMEVQLTVNWVNEPEAPLHVQQWRVEREDGAILSFGQERQFKRYLAVGKYKVEVRAKRDDIGQPLVAKSTLTVSPTEAVFVSQASARN